MSDIKDTPDNNYDEDFHFDDVDTSHDFAAPGSEALNANLGANASAGTKSNFGSGSFFDDAFSAKNKWGMQPRNSRKLIIFGFIIVVIVFFIIYHFASNWSNPFGELHHAAAPKSSESGASMTPAQIAYNEQQAKAAAEKAKMDEVENKANTLDQTINQQQQTITQLQANMEALQSSVSSLNSAVTAISGKLDALDSKLTKPVVKTSPRAASLPPSITYTIRAMVPGRAWLQASNGSSLSVAVGNEVPGHGTVANVDLNTGQVVMSDGSVFTYNIDGN